MGSRSKNKRGCGRNIFNIILALVLLAIVGALAWYFASFAKDVEHPVASCGGCYCIPDNTTAFSCPAEENAPTSYYPEETHINVWKSQTILNPYVLNCNPYEDNEDGAFCDTEPPLARDFQDAENAVCAVHYEQEVDVTISSTCENNAAYYRIKTYPSRADAESAGGFVTHTGHCGVCSTLQDLAV